MVEINSAWVALLAALLGGSGLKVIEYWLNRSRVRDTTAQELRKELREELTALREELKEADTALDEWKQKYYDLYDKLIQTRGELDTALRMLQAGRESAQTSLTEVQTTITNAQEALDASVDPGVDSKDKRK